MVFDPLTIVMLVILALVVFFMFRNSRKRQKDMAALQEKMVPGAEVMTNFGVYGKILSVDKDENQALLETTPGTILRVHRQAIARVIDSKDIQPPTETSEKPETRHETPETPVGEPEYGERVDTPSDASVDSQSGVKRDK